MQNKPIPSQTISLLTTFKMYDCGPACNNEEFTPEHWGQECVADDALKPPLKTFIPLTNASELELCEYLNEITVAVEMGCLYVGSNAVPKQFATVDVFEKFLSEMDVHYKRSLDSWGHSFQNVVKAADEIRRTTVPANYPALLTVPEPETA